MTIGDIFAQMGVMYAWATPEYLLDGMSINQIMLYYEKGIQAQINEAKIFWGVLGDALSEDEGKKKSTTDKPDLKKFYDLYGDKIKRG